MSTLRCRKWAYPAGCIIWERDVEVLVKGCKERLAVLFGAAVGLASAAYDDYPVCRPQRLNLL